MKPSTKTLFMLLAMLTLGIALGASGAILLRGRPPGPPKSRGGDGGFVAHMEQTIQPTDATQRTAIRPLLEATDQRNRQEVDRSRGAMRANLDSMLVELSPLLQPGQRDRLTELIQRLDRPEGPPGGPPGGRRPPP